MCTFSLRQASGPTSLAVLLILFLSGALAFGQTLSRTPIRDTLYNADGSLVEGVATISWKSFTAVDGSTVTNSYVDAPIVNGVLAIDLTANEGAVPSGLSYRVEYALDNGNRFTETWVVPVSAAALTVSDVRIALPPAPGVAVSQSQVSGLAAALGEKADLDSPNVFTGEQTIQESAPGANLLGLELQDGSQGVYFKLPALSQSTTYTLPFNDGLPNYALTTDGSGNLFWAPGGGGGGGAGGPAYDLFLADGTPLPQRTIADFSTAFQLTDNIAQLSTEIDLNFGTTAGTAVEGDDPRLSDARDPLAHAASHAAGAADAIAPASIGALGRANDFMVGTDPNEPVLLLQGAPSQVAGIQEWRDGTGELVSVITEQGSSFFREMGLAAKVGGTTVSQFFEIGGKKKFAFTAVDSVFDVARYDDNGVFKDRPLRIQRSGDMLANVSLQLVDPSIGSGTLRLTGDYVEVDEVVPPGSPGAGSGRIYLDSLTGELSVKKDDGSVVSLEQQQAQGTFAVFADAETPGGTIDGVNDAFTLADSPSPAESLTLTVNGVVQEPGVDFTLIGSDVTFLAGAIPQTGDSLLAWYRTSGFDAGGDLSGSFPQPTVTGIQNRAISIESPADGECLTWNQTAGEWEPGPCAVVTDSLVWHFAGSPSGGAQSMILTLPDGLNGVQLKDVRIVADTLGATDTTFNVERCTAGCTGASPTFSPIYLSDVTLTASTRTVLGGAPDEASVNGGDQFRINFVSVGTSASDLTVTLIFEHESFARLDFGFESLTGDCEAICGPVWEAAGMPPNPFGPAPKLGDACVCFGVGPPTRG